MYKFEKPLQEGKVIKRNSQFTMDVLLNGEIIRCHCPTTGRIGDIELHNIACLLSKSNDSKRKLSYTVEAVSCDEWDNKEKNWIGINQVLSNKLVEYFLQTHQLDKMISQYKQIKREVTLGKSKLDFLVGNTYLEVKTPLTTLHVAYGNHVKTKPFSPFSSTERFAKHIEELTSSLAEHERAILLTVHQYEITLQKPHYKSTHYDEISHVVHRAIEKGLEIWNADMKFTPIGVKILSLDNTTYSMK